MADLSTMAGGYAANHGPRMTGTDMDWRLSNGPVVEILVQAHRMKYAPPIISADRLAELDARTARDDARDIRWPT